MFICVFCVLCRIKTWKKKGEKKTIVVLHGELEFDCLPEVGQQLSGEQNYSRAKYCLMKTWTGVVQNLHDFSQSTWVESMCAETQFCKSNSYLTMPSPAWARMQVLLRSCCSRWKASIAYAHGHSDNTMDNLPTLSWVILFLGLSLIHLSFHTSCCSSLGALRSPLFVANFSFSKAFLAYISL